MAHSLEVREPLMDHPLVEWLASLPSDLKIRDGEAKFLLKKTMEGRLPDAVMHRPKMGFAVPLARWFRGPLRERVRTTLAGGELVETGLFDPSFLTRVADEHCSGARDHATPIWTLLMFDAFLRNVLTGSSRALPLDKAA